MASLRTAYLLLYNVTQAIGWGICLWQIITCVNETGSLQDSYRYAGDTVAIFQLASVLEIVHAALNIVKGSPVSALMQWAGRSNILFGVVRSVPEVQSTPYVAAMLLAWTISEVIRYPWYAATTAKICPFWLTWLRYTAFIPLYPVGVVGEMGAAWFALPLIKQRRLHSISLPHRWNVSFDYRVFMVGLLCVYPILWWQLYSLLLRQRRKKLGGAPGRRTKEE